MALRDFGEGHYASCVERLLPVRYRTHRLGGSFAQRDIIGWTLLEAALRARQFDLALALANERCALKPSSPQNWRYVTRALTRGAAIYSGPKKPTPGPFPCAPPRVSAP